MEEFPLKPKKRKPLFRFDVLFFTTLLLAIGYGLVTRLIFGTRFASSFLSTMSYSFLCLVPVVIGAITTFMVRRRESLGIEPWSWGTAVTTPLFAGLIFLAGVVVFNIEVMICIIMVLPLFLVAVGIGSLVMDAVVRYARRRAHARHSPSSLLAALLIAPYLLSPFEVRQPPPAAVREVHNYIDIDASAEAIWPQIVRVPAIQPHERQVRLSHLVGIPQPLEATLSQDGVGGMREASYDNGLRFEETVIDWQPPSLYRFTIRVVDPRELPAPFDQFGGPFEVYEASYRLEPLADGLTRLHLSSLYRLSTHINAYGTLWTDFLMWDLQQYILEIIAGRLQRAGS